MKPTIRRSLFLILVLLTINTLGLIAQEGEDELTQIMKRGMELADQGKFDLSLVEFQNALDIAPKNALANYQTAMLLYDLDNKGRALKYAKKAAKEESEQGIQALILSGTIHDELGHPSKAIRTYKKGIRKFGDYYLLHYNLAVTAYDNRKLELASESFQEAVRQKLDHAQSHFGLARTMSIQERRIEALYPLYFYLLLNPEVDEAATIIDRLEQLRTREVKSAGEAGPSPSPFKYDYRPEDPMPTAELIMFAMEASKQLEQYSEKSPTQIDQDLLDALFSQMASIDFKERDDLFTQYYIPFFSAIADEGQIEPFYHYTHQSANRLSREWVEENYERLELFFNWLDEEAPRLKSEDIDP